MDIQTLQGIASVFCTLVFTFLVSREESKPKDKRNKKYSKYGRPVLNQILKTKGINLSDSYVKEIYKTMVKIGKKKGVNEFHKNVTPKIEKILTKGLNEFNYNTDDDYKTRVAKSIVKDFIETEGINFFKKKSRFRRFTSRNKSRTFQKKDTRDALQLTKKKPRGILKITEPIAENSGLTYAPLKKGKFVNVKSSVEEIRSRKRSRR